MLARSCLFSAAVILWWTFFNVFVDLFRPKMLLVLAEELIVVIS
jgi:hypothetical protein